MTAAASIAGGPGRLAAGPTNAILPAFAATTPSSIELNFPSAIVATGPLIQSVSHMAFRRRKPQRSR